MTGDVKKRQINCGGNAAAPLSKRQHVNFEAAGEDRISHLPGDLMTLILRLPSHEMARTSILSKAWRNIWPMHPFLIFSYLFSSYLTSKKETNTHVSEFIKVFDTILSVHTGPIWHFYLHITPELRQCPIHQWFNQLSDKGLRSVCVTTLAKELYPVPSSLFDCPELSKITLIKSVVRPSVKAGSFTSLTCVKLVNTLISRDMTFGTQIKSLSLHGCKGIERLACQFNTGNDIRMLYISASTKIEWQWFQRTAKLINLFLDGSTLEVLGRPPSDLANPATKAANLKILTLHQLNIYNFCQILNAVYFIRSFPNVQDICSKMAPDQVKSSDPKESTIEQYFGSLNWKEMFLNQLQTVKFEDVVYSRYVLHLIKHFLASSPSLEVISIFFSMEFNDPEEKSRIKREVQQFPILSLDAQVIWC